MQDEQLCSGCSYYWLTTDDRIAEEKGHNTKDERSKECSGGQAVVRLCTNGIRWVDGGYDALRYSIRSRSELHGLKVVAETGAERRQEERQ